MGRPGCAFLLLGQRTGSKQARHDRHLESQHQRVAETLLHRILGRNRYPGGKKRNSFIAASVDLTSDEAICSALSSPQQQHARRTIMDGGTHYGRPPAYDDEDAMSPAMQGGSTMRLLTDVDDSRSYMSYVSLPRCRFFHSFAPSFSTSTLFSFLPPEDPLSKSRLPSCRVRTVRRPPWARA
jgi:hypothetical protein